MLRIALAFCISVLATVAAHAQCSTAYPKAALNSQVASDFPDNTSGQITPSIMRTFQNNMIQSVQSFPGVNQQDGTSYTIALADYGQLVLFTNNSSVAVTVPIASTAGFCPFGFYASQIGVGSVTFTPTSGTINGAATFMLTGAQSAFIVSDGTNWQVLSFKSGNVAINGGLANQLAYYATAGATLSGLTSANSSVLVTDNFGVPSWATTIPSVTITTPTFVGPVTGPDLSTWNSNGINGAVIGQSVVTSAAFSTLAFTTMSAASLAGSPSTITGLNVNNGPNTTNDFIPYYNAASKTIERATVGAISSAGASGVSSLNGATGALSLAAGSDITITPVTSTVTIGLTNNALTIGSTSMALGSTTGTINGALTFGGSLTLSSALTYGGTTLSNAVTGGGKMVLATSPTITGTGSASFNTLQTNTSAVTMSGLSTGAGQQYLCWASSNGQILINPSACATSDARLKKNLSSSPGLLDILQLHPVSFEWKDPDKFGAGRKVGLIAQEVEKVIPSVVSADDTDDHFKSLDYAKLVTPLIAGEQALFKLFILSILLNILTPCVLIMMRRRR